MIRPAFTSLLFSPIKEMNVRFIFVGGILFLLAVSAQAQVAGLIEDFNDQDLTGWQVPTSQERTYQLSVVDSTLAITYTRSAGSWAWDSFTYTPPSPVQTRQNPYLRLDVRSDVAVKLTLKPTYGDGQNDWSEASIPGDGQWRRLTFALNSFVTANLIRIDWYLDGGSNQPAQGLVQLDNLRIAGDLLVVQVSNLQATTVDSDRIALTWSCNYPEAVGEYRIYQSMTSGFTPAAENLVASITATDYEATGLESHRFYYFLVTAVESSGLESNPSNEAFAQTYASGTAPRIAMQSINSSEVGLYEKFEVVLSLENAVFDNPYDPEQIDVRAVFTSPSGRQWNLFGFYDDYQNRQQWKVRFSPNETGDWKYILYVTNANGTGRSVEHGFRAVPSRHHGWLHTSRENPHYFVHDDGSSFYGLAAYWPWSINNSESGLGALQASGYNLIGYWNVTYDDGTLIESLASGLGRYDQNKCNRIDAILQWIEQRNMVLMLAIWPHDLFSLNMAGWAALWSQNPYKALCSVLEIYENETAWKYQEKQYRYIIARWGYSRGLGIWEIMNEINGTDAWARGRVAQAEGWTRKVHAFLKNHDPFDRPTTASQSGGLYWPNGYAIFDVPNVHMYETSWPGKFNGNPLRSSLWTYHSVTRQMWDDFAKPAIMGEAGWLNNYGNYAGDSDEYAIMYHDALWVSWASGLASTPVWWGYDPRAMGPKVLQRMKMFAPLTAQIDYAHNAFHPTEVTVADAEAFGLCDSTQAFGWTRDYYGYDISERLMQLSGLADTVYAVQWFDTWAGKVVESHIRPCIQGVLTDQLPLMESRTADLAFTIKMAEIGTQPSRLELLASPRTLFSDGQSQSDIQCHIFDAQGRFCIGAQNQLQFSLIGLGRLIGPTSVAAQQGVATIILQSDSTGSGASKVLVSSPGLQPDTVIIKMTDVQMLEDFESYGSDGGLQTVWKVRSGTSATVALEKRNVATGAQALKAEYSIGNGRPPYSGFFRDFPQAFHQSRYLRFWLLPDASKRDLVIMLNENSSRYWQYQLSLPSEAKWIEVPLSEFKANSGAEDVELSKVVSISFNIVKGAGEYGSGVLYIDELAFTNSSQTGVDARGAVGSAWSFSLQQNFPNPFNASTEVRYSLPQRSQVTLSIFNIQGQLVSRLVQDVQSAGEHRVLWNGEGLPSGVYFYILETDNQVKKAKCLLLK